MKECPKCEGIQEDSKFGKKKNGRLQSWCKQCTSEYSQSLYRKDKSKWYARSRKTRHAAAKKVYEYLEAHPCEECGESRPACLQFDHIDPNTKVGSVSQLINKSSWNNVQKEIEKCRVLCANCHLAYTAFQFGWYKYMEVGS